jgi:hypothetical protein
MVRSNTDPELYAYSRGLMVRLAALRQQAPDALSYDVVKGVEEFQRFYQHIESRGLVERFGVANIDAEGRPLDADAAHFFRFYVEPFADECLNAPDPLHASDELLPHLEQSLEAKHAIWSVISPLCRFSTDCAPVVLPNDVSIVGLADDAKRHAIESVGNGQALLLGLTSAQFALHTTRDEPKGVPSLVAPPEFDRTVTALRLLKPGAASHPLVSHRLEYPRFGTPSPLGFAGDVWSPAAAVLGTDYTLAPQDVPDLVALLSAHWPAVHGRADLALTRFDYAYERARPEDRLIDLWVALEALFLGREEQQELAYRAALRVAHFVEAPGAARERAFREVKRSYSDRSKVVHGDRASGDVGQTVEYLESVLRKALRKVVVSGATPELKRLDGQIARGET